ncbi:MAG: hypothetical protein KJ057_05270 [Phycisphaerae bacterium]|nr:MAG: hypothetical protein EDS66_02040 [Planctomycetota bacterium]KAB2948753.1 MAG: hypothetical protein F9K17_05500 [Phycisphaerae bacterium]MBE7456828.1 hypothetical protein [Planctomycetia bacterium]MCK6464276.1 hypothetical protein [Phycisphaerae bacterium]MCL4717868.1 hypothetical protein [Phycisphaerae bacterium]
MPEPRTTGEFGCPRCFGPDPEAAWGHKLDPCGHLVDDSHFGVALFRCPDCHQMFVSIFTEFVDWIDGDDPQYWDRLPLTPAEAENLARQGEAVDLRQIEELGRDRRRLKVDYPKGSPRKCAWTAGGLAIVPGH